MYELVLKLYIFELVPLKLKQVFIFNISLKFV